MKSNTTMQLVTLPAVRQIHPLGHSPSQAPEVCRPRPVRGPASSQTSTGALEAADSVVMGIAVRNAPQFRRRRAVAAVLATAVLLAAWSLLSLLAHHLVPTAAGDPVPVSAAAVHVVQPGDTLWSIAGEVLDVPGGRVRHVVDQLASRTGGASLRVGQHVPIGGLDFG